MPRRFVLFGDDFFAYVGLVAAVASARHPCPALATELFIPSKIGVVFADPAYAKTNRAVLIHSTLDLPNSEIASDAVSGWIESYLLAVEFRFC